MEAEDRWTGSSARASTTSAWSRKSGTTARCSSTPRACWVTNPRAHPFHVEYLRFEPDSPVDGPVRHDPHVAYRVDDVDAAIAGHEVVLAPFDVADGFCGSHSSSSTVL